MKNQLPTPLAPIPPPMITVAGLTFAADQIVSAVVLVDGREVTIGKKDDKQPIGFRPDFPC